MPVSLQLEHDRQRVAHVYRLAVLCARLPLRHGLDDADGFLVQAGINAADYFDIGHTAVGSHDKLGDDAAFFLGILCILGILDVVFEVLQQFLYASGKFRGYLYDIKYLVIS